MQSTLTALTLQHKAAAAEQQLADLMFTGECAPRFFSDFFVSHCGSSDTFSVSSKVDDICCT